MMRFALVLLLAIPVAGCLAQDDMPSVMEKVRSDFPDVSQVSTDSLAALIVAESEVLILDTRKKDEYEVSHIPGAIWVDPDATSFPELQGIDAQTQIVAYCSVGYRSSKIARRLSDVGYLNVSNLEGSIFQWANEGRQVVNENGDAEKVHPFNAVWGRLLNEDLRY